MSTVSKNIFWSTLTSLLQLYTGSIVFIVLAKIMSVENFGILSFGFSLSALAVIVADFGFSLMIMKDYPQLDKNKHSYLFNSILAKVILAVLTAALFYVYLVVFYEGDWLVIGGIYVLFSLTASFIIYLQSLLRIQNKFNKYTYSNTIYAIVVSLSVIIYWQFDLSLFQLVICFLISKLIQLLWTAYFCRSSFFKFSIDFKLIKDVLKSSWSFGLFSILGIFYFMIDTQIISLYLGARDVALYQSVFRIILILMVFSDIVSNVMLPFLSYKLFKNDNINELTSKILLYLLIVGCSIFLLFTTFKNEILLVLYTPEYAKAAILVLPFSIVLILRTISTLLGNILTVSNMQRQRVITVGVALLFSLVLNLVFIPVFGIIAAAWISVIVHFILFSMYFIYSRFKVPNISLFSGTNFIILGATIGIYTVIEYFKESALWVLPVCAAIWIIVVYKIMMRNGNFIFLKQVLKERGIG